MDEREAIAAIRVISAVARADGKISEEERVAFQQAIAEFGPQLSSGANFEELLTQPTDLAADLAEVKTPLLRKSVFETAYAMSIIDGSASEEENKILAQIRDALGVGTEETVMSRVLAIRRGVQGAVPILDPKERAARVQQIIRERSAAAAIFGFMPIPIVSEVLVMVQIDSVITGVSEMWGQPLTRKEAFARFGVVLSMALAQGAVHSLFKSIPGIGWVVGSTVGGVTAYAVTRSIGAVVNYHFEKGGDTTPAELKKVFAESKAEAKKAYETDKAAIEEHSKEVEALTKKLERNEISVEEFDKQVEALMKKSS